MRKRYEEKTKSHASEGKRYFTLHRVKRFLVCRNEPNPRSCCFNFYVRFALAALCLNYINQSKKRDLITS